MSLDVQAYRKWKGFELDVHFRSQGGTLGILGASGCGKSMTLKCIAGIETPTQGKISIGDRVLYDSRQRVNVRPQQRKIGYLFHSYALFPNMRVGENIACALGGVPKEQRGKIVADMLERFRLTGLEDRYPAQLSGGQQQRVALARILAYEPEALLLDEPFSALDFYLKEQLQLELLDLLRDYAGDVVIVTHSRDEVYHLCRRLMVMENGKCVASGDTRELFRRPETLTVARLTGCKNTSVAVPLGEHRILAVDWGIELETGDPVPANLSHVGVRAHDFHPAVGASETNAFPVAPVETLESPFEWNILLMPDREQARQKIWWKVEKSACNGPAPTMLAVSPEHVLLLSNANSTI